MQGTAIVRHVVTFGRVLREVGIEVGPGRDAASVAWFLRGPVAPLVREKQSRQLVEKVVRGTLDTGRNGDEPEQEGAPLELGASAHEILREKDFTEMSAEEFERARRLMAASARGP